MTGQAIILRGDALNLPLPDESVDLIVTSPPYFALRSYRDSGEHYDGQIGSEPTPKAFLEALWAVTAEMKRVLKPSGSIFVNLGDKYAGSGGHNNSSLAPPRTGEFATRKHNEEAPRLRASRRSAPDHYNKASDGVRAKSLMGLPWRYAIGCIDDLDLILRAEIVWSKPNGVPESVRDRVRRSHEQWFHFTKEGSYFSAMDEVREPHTGHFGHDSETPNVSGNGVAHRSFGRDESLFNPLGRVPGSVWRIPSEPLKIPAELGIDHFAAFPTEWPRRLILGWSPSGVCVVCGEGRFPVAEVEHESTGRTNSGRAKRQTADGVGLSRGFNEEGYPHTIRRSAIIGYVCACTPFTDHPGSGESSPTATDNGRQGARPADIAATHRRVGPWREYHFDQWDAPDIRPAVVLDPFGGTGTTALVAKTLGRVGISVDLSHDYCRLARWRVHESGHGRKALARTWAERQEGLAL